MGVMLELVRRGTVNLIIRMDGRFDSFCSHIGLLVKWLSYCTVDAE